MALQTQYSNVTDPLLLHNHVEAAEAVILAADTQAYLLVTGLGALPAAGAYVIGVNALDRSAGEVSTVTTDGIEIVKVNAGATIAVDSPISAAANGAARLATGGDYVVGRARDTSAGSTLGAPHYIRLALGR